MRCRPDLDIITSTYKSMQDTHNSLFGEPLVSAHFKVKPAWYPSLKPIIEELESIKGFSPSMVLSVVANGIRDLLRVDDIMSEEAIVSWEPSIDWVRWFMRTQMDYRFRRVESPRMDESTLTEINRIHSINQDRIRLYMDMYKFQRKDLIMSDQFGLLVHPCDDRVWCRKGNVAEGDGKEDKRQITGNFFLRGDGSLLRVELTFP